MIKEALIGFAMEMIIGGFIGISTDQNGKLNKAELHAVIALMGGRHTSGANADRNSLDMSDANTILISISEAIDRVVMRDTSDQPSLLKSSQFAEILYLIKSVYPALISQSGRYARGFGMIGRIMNMNSISLEAVMFLIWLELDLDAEHLLSDFVSPPICL